MSELNSKCLIFAGPTLNGSLPMTKRGVEVLPPVKRGDIQRLVSRRRPAVIAIVDGLFHQCLAVGHAEIRAAILAGWQVWGLSSMGAIRAYEMRHMSVRGYGQVYKSFCNHEDFRDDEVALVHFPEPPYLGVSEPLVHIRVWLKELMIQGILTTRQERRLLRDLMSMWFGDRTLPVARSMIVDLAPQHETAVDATLANFDRFRVKRQDLLSFLKEQPWKV